MPGEPGRCCYVGIGRGREPTPHSGPDRRRKMVHQIVMHHQWEFPIHAPAGAGGVEL